MKDFIKKFWWVVLLAALSPLFVNWLLSISTGIKVYENGWLGFWGSLLGALFSFIILYKTLIDNHKENEKERKVQVETIKYQVSKESLNDLKENITAYYKAMNVYEMEMIAIKSQEDISYSLNVIWRINKETENAYQVLRLTLVDYTDPKENEYKDFLDKFHLAFNGFLSDFTWLIDGKCSLDDYKKEIKKFGNISVENLRIWKIIEDRNLDKETDGKLIMDELLDRIEYKAIYIRSEDFIKYESDKMNRELEES